MKSKKVLVTGGAGYIGSHMTRVLLSEGFEPVVFDALTTGHKDLIPKGVRFIKGDLLNRKDIAKAMAQGSFAAVIHFAGLIAVGESVQKPLAYFENNVNGSLHLIEAWAKSANPGRFVFSSTAAVYALASGRLRETSVISPENPYGWSKLAIEKLLTATAQAHKFPHTILRYFNACGAHPSGETGEWHDPETHLIPNVLKAAKAGRAVKIFGSDYPTKDGTCVRDYIHVMDLCYGHLAALRSTTSGIYNLGTGHGHSVLEVVRAAEKVVGHPIKVDMTPRRAGDAVKLVADPSKAMKELNWKAERSLKDMIATAWAWENRKQG